MKEKTKTTYQEIGQRIVAFRKSQGVSQVQLATALGISKNLLCAYEKGRRRIPATNLAYIAQYLEVSADECLGLKEIVIDGRNANVKLMRRFQRIIALPDDKRKRIIKVLDSFLAEAEI